MRNNSIYGLFIVALLVVELAGCAPSLQSIAAVPLELDDQKITLEFLQNDVNVPVTSQNGQLTVVLKPEPFTLNVNGNKDIVSITALQSEDLAAALLQSSRPWVAPLGTGNVEPANDLYLSYEAVSFYKANTETFQNFRVYSFSEEKAAGIVASLTKQLGTEPLALVSARTYLGDQKENYLIKTINKHALQDGQSIFLLVFIEKQADDPLFKVIKWVGFHIEFKNVQ